MQPFILVCVLLLLSLAGYYMGRQRSLETAGGSMRALHSLPSYYGWYLALWCGLPSILLFAAWLVVEPRVVEGMVVADLPQSIRDLPPAELKLFLNDVRNMATGNIVSQSADPAVHAA